MNEKQAAYAATRRNLFAKTGWLFVTTSALPELEDVGVIQRFRASTGEHVHEVRCEDYQVRCTCPGWRKYRKCWHIQWVLLHNVGVGLRLGSFLERAPKSVEIAELDRSDGWASWLREHMAVVDPVFRPPAPNGGLTPSSNPCKWDRRCPRSDAL